MTQEQQVQPTNEEIAKIMEAKLAEDGLYLPKEDIIAILEESSRSFEGIVSLLAPIEEFFQSQETVQMLATNNIDIMQLAGTLQNFSGSISNLKGAIIGMHFTKMRVLASQKIVTMGGGDIIV